LRLGTSVLKMLFVVLLSKELSVGDLAIYGNLTAYLQLMILVIGLDLYSYTNREILNKDQETWVDLFFIQFVASLTVLFVSLFLLTHYSSISTPIFIFCVILYMDYVCQEVIRLLNALGLHEKASIIIFAKNGLYSSIWILLLMLGSEMETIEKLIKIWMSSLSIAVLLGVLYVRQEIRQFRLPSFDINLLSRALKSSAYFFLGTLATRYVLASERLMFENRSSVDEFVAITLMFTFSLVFTLSLDTTLYSFRYPKVLEYGKKNDYYRLKNTIDKMVFATFFFSIPTYLLLKFNLENILTLLDKQQLTPYAYLFDITFLSVFLRAIASCYNMGLFAIRNDSMIVSGNFMAAFVFTACIYIEQSSLGVMYGIIASAATVAFYKGIAFNRMILL
jgi:O-antigen/teichoic acid export membrane protein